MSDFGDKEKGPINTFEMSSGNAAFRMDESLANQVNEILPHIPDRNCVSKGAVLRYILRAGISSLAEKYSESSPQPPKTEPVEETEKTKSFFL